MAAGIKVIEIIMTTEIVYTVTSSQNTQVLGKLTLNSISALVQCTLSPSQEERIGHFLEAENLLAFKKRKKESMKTHTKRENAFHMNLCKYWAHKVL